jgi:hypothetical protein
MYGPRSLLRYLRLHPSLRRNARRWHATNTCGKVILYARFDTSNVFGASKTFGARVQLLIFPRHTLSTSTLRLAPPRHSPLFRLY